MSHLVQLDWPEISMAASVGTLRHVEALRRSHERPDGTIPAWDEDIEGACAELAVAKILRVPWTGSVNAFCEADVGGCGVRHTKRPEGCLIIRRRDWDRYGGNAIFILVTGERGRYTIQGWLDIERARNPGWWRSPNGWGGAYFVPTQALLPIEGLPR